MTDVAVDTLRLRGPHARRLAAVAARALPSALERAMADVGDVRLDRVEVSLDLDPSDYDDQTLAILWADAIRARVLATAPAHRPPAGPTPATEEVPAPVRTPEPAEVLAVLRDWLTATERPTAPPMPAVLPAAVLALGDPAVARAVRAAADPGEWARLLTTLENALRTTETVASEPTTRLSPATEPEVSEPDVLAPVGPAAAPHPGVVGEHVPGERVAVLDTLAVLAELMATPTGPAGATTGLTTAAAAGVDLAAVTRAAGLVLLYPWLADHCRRAEALHPGLDVLDVREAALAAIVDPDDLTLADDPLVGLLAGRPNAPVGRRIRVELDRHDEVAESGAQVLASFAALLPGFGNSTGMFVRDSWIRRLGVVHRDRDPALLVAATHPLDVVLPMLPYPIGLVKLPWSRPLSVRFAP